VSGHGSHSSPWRQVAIVSVFAVALSYLESAALIYLRNIFPITSRAGVSAPSPANIWKSLPYAALLKPSALLTVLPNSKLAHMEMWRGAAAIVVIVCMAWLVGSNLKNRTAFFLYIFGVWNIAHYVFLRLLSGWPTSPSSKDVLFMIPGPSVAAVWVPVLVSAAMIAVGIFILKREEH
jgi:hypothetical protein